mmetsp:Transcript_9054/g.28872  ORF Transcript_9054/g.28872 Transcript_9054/m.28872 type:complete len:296 (+) Transcript_9054:253-1140(+)
MARASSCRSWSSASRCSGRTLGPVMTASTAAMWCSAPGRCSSACSTMTSRSRPAAQRSSASATAAITARSSGSRSAGSGAWERGAAAASVSGAAASSAPMASMARSRSAAARPGWPCQRTIRRRSTSTSVGAWRTWNARAAGASQASGPPQRWRMSRKNELATRRASVRLGSSEMAVAVTRCERARRARRRSSWKSASSEAPPTTVWKSTSASAPLKSLLKRRSSWPAWLMRPMGSSALVPSASSSRTSSAVISATSAAALRRSASSRPASGGGTAPASDTLRSTRNGAPRPRAM